MIYFDLTLSRVIQLQKKMFPEFFVDFVSKWTYLEVTIEVLKPNRNFSFLTLYPGFLKFSLSLHKVGGLDMLFSNLLLLNSLKHFTT